MRERQPLLQGHYPCGAFGRTPCSAPNRLYEIDPELLCNPSQEEGEAEAYVGRGAFALVKL